ncbi:MAG: DUF4439 domain-containing protein, partial [Sciscionella sp.]|nr:DUF4439 domain-containing protein [Sciscionella sp.]
MSGNGPTFSRRRALGAGLALTAVPLASLAAACTPNAGDAAPDPLLALADAARADVATAIAISAGKPSPV